MGLFFMIGNFIAYLSYEYFYRPLSTLITVIKGNIAEGIKRFAYQWQQFSDLVIALILSALNRVDEAVNRKQRLTY